MIPDLTIKRGDAGKIIAGQLKDGDLNPVDCTGHSLRRIIMRPIGGGDPKIDASFEFTEEDTGSWTYTMQAEDVDTNGTFLLEHKVTWPGATPQTVTFPTDPDQPYMIVRVQGDLG